MHQASLTFVFIFQVVMDLSMLEDILQHWTAIKQPRALCASHCPLAIDNYLQLSGKGPNARLSLSLGRETLPSLLQAGEEALSPDYCCPSS